MEDDLKSISTYDGDSRAGSSIFSDPAGVPVRPPRKKKKGGRGGSVTDSSVPGSILQRRRSVRSSIRSNRSARSSRRGRSAASGPVSYNPSGPPSFVSDHPFRRSGQRNLRRSDSRGQSDFGRRSARRSSRRGPVLTKTPGFMNANKANGDVYTRVAIPRSKSFMNVNSQYNLQELFKELKEKEGVESIDDVLKKIISPNGISFNEIKPVYRELLLKLAMTMSQDELFQRSKNIMSQEKKKSTTKAKDKSKKDKKAYPVSASEQSTLSSFLKLNFSSSKTSSSKASTMAKDNKKSLSKTDISGPIPIHPPPSMAKTPKTTRKATSPLPPLPINNNKPGPVKKQPPQPSPDDFVDDAYVSCSDCCYESACTYDTCSCSGSNHGGGDHKKIPPPRPYHTQTTKAQVHHSSGDSESVCDCDADSCISSEKCYCSLRKDPRVNMTKTRSSVQKLPPIPSSDSESCCTHMTASEISDSATDTTCYSVRHVPIQRHNHHMSLSGAETPQTAWRRNSRTLNHPESDTYSDAGVILNSSSAGSSSSGAGSCKMCEIHHSTHHNKEHPHLSRKNSGGSGYQSNDSNCCSSHAPPRCHCSRPQSNSPPSCQCTSACSSCQTSLAGSLMSNRRSRPKLSLPSSHSHINLSAAGLGSPIHDERSCRGRSMSPQKQIIVSAIDKTGKVI